MVKVVASYIAVEVLNEKYLNMYHIIMYLIILPLGHVTPTAHILIAEILGLC